MAYRVKINFDDSQVQQLRSLGANASRVVEPVLRDSLNLLKQYAVQNLSGVPFHSESGTHIINKRSGKGAASVQVQYPYGSPFKGRVFANAQTQYADNPDSWNYLAILEYGRGEIKPKYTPSMRGGNPSRARLTLPGGGHELRSGVNGFRGVTGRYRFIRSIPPMVGKGWMSAAVESAKPEFDTIARTHLQRIIDESA